MIRHQEARSSSVRAKVRLNPLFGALFLGLVASFQAASTSFALELDWSGQFRAEYNFVHNYSMDGSATANSFDATRNPETTGGYYVPSGGNRDASFQTLFLKLKPKLVVNDNIYIKSEFWVGNPAYSIFGDGVPYWPGQRQFYSSQSAGSFISAQRFWGEFLSDIGTVQVGRAPLNWGLGLVWNSGDGLWDRFQSTGDTIRLISKFGAFSVMPSVVIYSSGNNVGGALPIPANTAPSLANVVNGDGGVREYSLSLKYENLDDELEGGLNFIKRLGGAAQDPVYGYLGPQQTTVSFNYDIWDIYAKKRLGKFVIGAEVPITTGNLGTTAGQNMSYSTFAAALELDYKFNDTWEFQLKGGHAPGQPNWSGSATPGTFKEFFFNPAYRLGLIMFNYQLANFAGPNTNNNPASLPVLKSPYDNPIVNANYLLLNPTFHTDKWTFGAKFIYAIANQSAAAGQNFCNTVTRRCTDASGNPYVATEDQSKSLGFETDLGATFQWDEYFQFHFETGIYLPGAFYKFSNSATGQNATSPVFALTAAVGVNF
jgi:hypothetical protein